MMMLIDDDRKQCVRKSECPNCRRLFCAKCKVSWHSGIVCSEFRKLKKNEREKEDVMLMKLAHNKRWGRCPDCSFLVEKRNGCSHIKCSHKHMLSSHEAIRP
ncbi:hypothetical protein FEM48_Zijuj02G0031300 [Ziziphus jujuba var. spinosa]|uniref:RBR-type E3 ubiquitin transferase n=1 Tax=Ziziphus jujuba var. spinosa TaxID=714518 RepID=A0A978VT95_ZIZJJ|nr:hypothetical protein FEM48_Zijuj02G0031300 [Ziziphus jujuba var. spinosa]